MSLILVIDDEPSICWSFREFLTEAGHNVRIAGSHAEALRELSMINPDLVVTDVRLPDGDGLSILATLNRSEFSPPVIMMTAFGDLETAVRAVELGAFDYLTKPFELDTALQAVVRALESTRHVTDDTDDPEVSSRGDQPRLIGSSPPIQQVYKDIALAATSTSTVLIIGETGVGKELVARAIHRHGSRRQGPFVPVCLATLNASVLESELFGHVRGSFTGALDDRAGLIEQAQGGVFFLDEIGDTPLSFQVKLLRFLESREFCRVGSNQMKTADVRIVAATNRNLIELIRNGSFREDLYYRLRGIEIRIPALRDRLDDVVALATEFARQAAPRKAVSPFDASFVSELKSRSWPGNVRELRSAIMHAVIQSRGGALLPQHLPSESVADDTNILKESLSTKDLQASIEAWVRDRMAGTSISSTEGALYRDFLAAVEPTLLWTVLKACDSNRANAARCLGIDRTTLRTRLRSHGLDGLDSDE